MNKTDAIAAVIAATIREPIVFTTGYACRIARALADRPNHFYMTGSMGLASSIGIGIAMETGGTTVVVDGDGSLLMNPVGLITAGTLGDLPLVHLVLDDGKYASTGGQDVPSAAADLGGLARASGYPTVRVVDEVAGLASILSEAIESCTAPVFVHCVVRDADPPVPPRIDGDLGEHAARFGQCVRELVAR